MSRKKLLCTVGCVAFFLGAFVGIHQVTVHPHSGPPYEIINFLLPWENPAPVEIAGGGTLSGKVSYFYGLLNGGLLNPESVELMYVGSGSQR